MNRMQERYRTEIAPALIKAFGFKNAMQAPRVEKVVVNIGVGEALDNPKALEAAVGDLTTIVGQKPVTTKARKSIANFKLREGRLIGVKVTLRGERMWAFLDRLLNVALPRGPRLPGCPPMPLTAAATTPSACGTSWSSRRSNTTRSTSCAAWRSRS